MKPLKKSLVAHNSVFSCFGGGSGLSFVFLLALLLCVTGPVFAQSNILLNGSFETADMSQGWWGITSWTSTHQWGGAVISNVVEAQDGDTYNRINAFGFHTPS